MTILITIADLDTADVERIRHAAASNDVVWRPCRRAAQIGSALEPGVSVLLADGLPDSIDRGPDLQWIQLASSGVDGYRASPAWAAEALTITNARGVAAAAISEYVIGTMLQHAHRLPAAQAVRSARAWPTEYEPLEASLLFGCTIGIIGYGSVGRRIASIAHQLGMHVISMRSAAPPGRADLDWTAPEIRALEGTVPLELVGPDGKSDLLTRADYVVITVPRTPATTGLLDKADFDVMKPGAVLVNVARGGIVDEGSMLEALKSGRLAAAIIDVTEQEPPPATSPLYDSERVLMTPHIAGYFHGYMSWVARLFVDNLTRFLDNRPLLNVVDRRRGY